MTPELMNRYLDLMTQAALCAGRASLACRKGGLRGKAADKAVEGAMLAALAQCGDVTVISEETPSACRPGGGLCFMVDPIDGTDGFDRGAAEFANCIGLLEEATPVAGVVCAPGHGFLTRGDTVRARAEELCLSGDLDEIVNLRTLRPPGPEMGGVRRAVIGQSELTPGMLQRLKLLNVSTVGLLDSAISFLQLVRGDADVLVRLAPNMEWDVAAGHALVRSVGGEVYDLENRPLQYLKPGLCNHGFIATTIPSRFPSLRDARTSAPGNDVS